MTNSLKIRFSTVGGRETLPLILAVVAIFVALVFRNTGLYPYVFADEYYYSRFSRLLPFAESMVPNYIYFFVFRITNYCNDGFLGCARVINAIFFVGSAPFLYLTARRFCTVGVASVIMLLSLLGPINSYTAYFMPEALYFFSFWLFTWYIFRIGRAANAKNWIIAGGLLAVASLIKPHAILLLPAICAYIFYLEFKATADWPRLTFTHIAIFIVFVLMTRLSFGYLFAGRSGLNILGSFYSTIATSATSKPDHYIKILTFSYQNAIGHLLAICTMFGATVGILIYSMFHSHTEIEQSNSSKKISIYAFLVLGSLIGVSAIFTGTLLDASENLRIHMRYYNFAFPLFFMIAAANLNLESPVSAKYWRIGIALPIGVAILYSAYTQFSPYKPALVDSPELRGFSFYQIEFYFLCLLSFISLILWVGKQKLGAFFVLFCFMPFYIFLASYYNNKEITQLFESNVYDKAGIFAKNYLSKEERNKLLVVGEEPGGLFRSLFYIDSPQSTFEVIPSGSSFDPSKLPLDKKWVLYIGDKKFDSNASLPMRLNGFTLQHLVHPMTEDYVGWATCTPDANVVVLNTPNVDDKTKNEQKETCARNERAYVEGTVRTSSGLFARLPSWGSGVENGRQYGYVDIQWLEKAEAAGK